MTFEKHISILNDDTYYLKKESPRTTSIIESINMEWRLKRIIERQEKATSQFMTQIENLKKIGAMVEMSPTNPAFIADHNYALSNSSSGVSSASSTSSATSTTPSVVNKNQRFNRYSKLSVKRKIFDDEPQYYEFSAEDDHHLQQSIKEEQQEYPLQLGDIVTLGPNGTQVDMRCYSSIIWSSAASATRQLLGFVFTSDILATHTLTGKPSPAFYGRERPPKMQLDPIKAADIIYCVRSKFNCTEREIRAAITTKCSDTSKKYKRRLQKQLESSQKM